MDQPAPGDVTFREQQAARARIESSWRRHDLSRRELASVHRAVRALDRRGEAPDPNQYWAEVAWPRAKRLVAAVTASIDDEFSRLPEPGPAPDASPLALVSRPGQERLEALGRWWHQRLRWAALATTLPRGLSLSPADLERAVADAELQLLGLAPWSQGDRLLSAFEVAHRDLRALARHRLAAGADDVGGRERRPSTAS